MLTMRNQWKLRLLGLFSLVLLLLAGCGDDHHFVFAGPGFVAIEDSPTVAITAPELNVEYTRPGIPGSFEARILSDQILDGDIEFDPFSGTFIITQGPSTLFFGIDSASDGSPEFRAFLDFPLEGSTGGDVVPLDANINSATLAIFVEFVDFAVTVPVALDLVEYSVVTGLVSSDFDSVSLGRRFFNVFNFDAGSDVLIDVTALMQEVQLRGLSDFQVRFSVGL